MKREEQVSGLEERTRAALEQSLERIDGRVRLRLGQARIAALAAAAARPGTARWRRLTLVPATGALAAVVLAAVLLWNRQPRQLQPPADQTAFDVIDLLGDQDGVSLVENGDRAFYEWAAAQPGTGTAPGKKG